MYCHPLCNEMFGQTFCGLHNKRFGFDSLCSRAFTPHDKDFVSIPVSAKKM